MFHQKCRRTPNFLIIGAMKAGTTTLWGDLRKHPALFFPLEKEPGNLMSDDVWTDSGQRNYWRMFDGAGRDQLCGEASTHYTKLPHIPGVAERAATICGKGLKLVYIVRNPLHRTISHHRHAVFAGDTPPDINEAIMADPRFINYSRYAMQLEPWLKAFGRANVHVIRFETFVKNRTQVLDDLYRFLGVESVLFESQGALNTKDSLLRLNAVSKRLSDSAVYKRYLRPLVSSNTRTAVAKLLNRGLPSDYCGRPSPHTLQLMLHGVQEDSERLARMLDKTALWDLKATVLELGVG